MYSFKGIPHVCRCVRSVFKELGCLKRNGSLRNKAQFVLLCANLHDNTYFCNIYFFPPFLRVMMKPHSHCYERLNPKKEFILRLHSATLFCRHIHQRECDWKAENLHISWLWWSFWWTFILRLLKISRQPLSACYIPTYHFCYSLYTRNMARKTFCATPIRIRPVFCTSKSGANKQDRASGGKSKRRQGVLHAATIYRLMVNFQQITPNTDIFIV